MVFTRENRQWHGNGFKVLLCSKSQEINLLVVNSMFYLFYVLGMNFHVFIDLWTSPKVNLNKFLCQHHFVCILLTFSYSVFGCIDEIELRFDVYNGSLEEIFPWTYIFISKYTNVHQSLGASLFLLRNWCLLNC